MYGSTHTQKPVLLRAFEQFSSKNLFTNKFWSSRLDSNLIKYRHLSDDRSMPIDQQGLGWGKVGHKMIDQQRAGYRGNLAQSEDAKLKAQLQIPTDFSHADQICMATLVLSGPI